MRKIFLSIIFIFISVISVTAKTKVWPDSLLIVKVEQNGVRVSPANAPHYILRYPDKFMIGKEKWKILDYHRDAEKGEAFEIKRNGKKLIAVLFIFDKDRILDEPLFPSDIFPFLQKFYGPIVFNGIFALDDTYYYVILPKKKTYFENIRQHREDGTDVNVKKTSYHVYR